MHVEFKPQGSNQSWSSTAELPIVPGESTNFLVAGMLPNTTYLMRHVLNDGTTSAPLTFKTGSLPTNVTFPTFTVQQAPAPGTDLTQNIVFHFGIGSAGTVDTLATDLMGNVEWYYDPVANGFPSFATSLVPGGTVLLLGGHAHSAQGGEDTLREVDLAGDTLRETNIDAVNAELAALGQHAITDFNHDVQRLPNGDTAVLATTPRTINVKGKPTLYQGDMVLVLDQNFQVAWVWDPFKWLNVHRLPTLGEGPTDWTHANSIAWSPADGNLIVSLRSQDWVIKINYANGTRRRPRHLAAGAGRQFPDQFHRPSPRGSRTSTTCAISTTRRWCCSTTGTPAAARTRERIAADRNWSWTRRGGWRRWWSMPTWATMPPSRGVRRCYPTGTSSSIPRLPSRQSRCFLMAERLMCSR